MKLLKRKTNIDFMGKRRLAFVLSGVLIIAALGSLVAVAGGLAAYALEWGLHTGSELILHRFVRSRDRRVREEAADEIERLVGQIRVAALFVEDVPAVTPIPEESVPEPSLTTEGDEDGAEAEDIEAAGEDPADAQPKGEKETNPGEVAFTDYEPFDREEIQRAAKEIVGDEKNPYWMARRIFDWVNEPHT